MISVVLFEPEHPGNVGAVARVMQNFDFQNLILVNPKCDHLSSEAIARSKHAKSILAKAKVLQSVAGFDCLIGTTARLGTDYNIPRSPILSNQLNGIVPGTQKVWLVFGSEGYGLSNDFLRKCDFVVHIPTPGRHSTLNLSHAVAIVLYDLSRKASETKLKSRFALATAKEKNLLLKNVDNILDKMDFPTKEKKETQRIVWKRIVGKSFLTKREAFALFGFFKRLKR